MPLRPLSNRVVGYTFFALFVLLIPLMNWGITNIGFECDADGVCVIPVWPGIMAPSSVAFAGIALVLRDGLQERLGIKWSIYAILIGAVLSAFCSEPSLVIASGVAFLFSEMADLTVYTPLRKKWPAWAIMASGLVGSIVDSAIFLSLAFGSLEYILGQVLGKLWMSVLVAIIVGTIHAFKRRTLLKGA